MSPLERLVSAILLSAVRQRAAEIRVHSVEGRGVLVELLVDGKPRQDQEMPATLYAPLLAAFARKADVALPGPDEVAAGTITIEVGQARRHRFALQIRAARLERTIHLREIAS